MARFKSELLTGILTIALAVVAALLTSGMRLGAIESRTLRNEQDIRELRLEIRDSLRDLKTEAAGQRDLLQATKSAIERHEARQTAIEERRGR